MSTMCIIRTMSTMCIIRTICIMYTIYTIRAMPQQCSHYIHTMGIRFRWIGLIQTDMSVNITNLSYPDGRHVCIL